MPCTTVLERIEKYSMPEPNTGCWPWFAAIRPDGYGAMAVNGGTQVAHLATYEELVGKVPAGLQLDHKCRVRSCINPEHLEPVTHKINSLRGVGAPAVNARKTSCPKGHPFTLENTLRDASGWRRCKICKHAYNLEYFPTYNRLRGRAKNPIGFVKTHCKHGHEYGTVNVYVKKNGGRECRICRDNNMQKFRAKMQCHTV